MPDKIILILGLILGIAVCSTFIIVALLRSKRDFVGKVKHGNTEASLKVIKGDSKEEDKPVPKDSPPPQVVNESEFDLDKLISHRFFTTILCQYTSENYIFNLYNETLRLGVRNDSEEEAQFKKLVASKYLHLCLFKVLGEHVKKWITDLVDEVSHTKNYTKIPATFYTISQYITQYKSEAYREGKSIEFRFQDKQFYGIPSKFMTRFNDWSDTNMIRVYNMISDVLYSTQNNWFARTIELLDLLEVIFMMLHDQMDATLTILNGEITNFLKRLNEDNIEII
jgi:hypothetical protein